MKASLTLTNCKVAIRVLLLLLLPFASLAQAPANNLCGNAISLTSSTTCSTTSGDLASATFTSISALGCGAGPSGNKTYPDVWYSFQAKTSNPTITLSSSAQVDIQLFSGSCGSLVSMGCDDATIAASGLNIGDTYFVRVYTTNKADVFTLCVTDPPANDDCGGAIPLTSGPTCNNTSGTLNIATSYTTVTGACINNSDVWYKFVAKTTNPTITVGGALATPRAQIYAGTCGGFTTVGSCPTAASTPTSGLKVGDTYYVRVYSNTAGATGTFDICVQDLPPANDDCAGAIALTSATSCNPTSGNFFLSTAAATPANAPCVGPVVSDVWYSFVAQTTNPTITLGSLGTDITSPGLQLFSGNCSGLTSLFCSTTSIASSGLIIGNTYFVRAYSTSTAPTASTNAGFNICVTDKPALDPANDECTGAFSLPVNSTCTKTFGTLVGATNSGIAIPSPCSVAGGPDVWYQFVATSVSATITLGDFGTSFGATRQFQLFTGTCAGLSPVTCVSGTGASVTLSSTTLSPGVTYYVRVFSNAATPPASNGGFSICIKADPPAQRFGNSYVNITKKTVGGVVEPGDILEIRMTVNHTSGTMLNMRYVDNVPSNTQMLTGATDKISVITNEGVAIQSYTLAANDDAATYIATPPSGDYQIRMNLGFNNSTTVAPTTGIPTNTSIAEFASATGQAVAGADIPKGGGGMLFATAFRVKVTGNVGDVITLGDGKFAYRTSAGGPDIVLPTIPYKILISQPMSLCANATGVNMSEEFGGTFGSGNTLNRSTDLAFPIPGYTLVKASSTQTVGDGQYAIVNNMSPLGGTSRTVPRQPSTSASADRMYGHWDVDGDHTGTTNNIGNVPVANGTNGGYMLMVNADFIASETYRQTLTNLCPNTYYEFSAWFRNICPTCGIDYKTGSNYSPMTPGVLPNLTFALDGFDRYNTGEIAYLNVGGYSGGWVKKGFVFITGPTQTTATVSIRNNSQGGGGNDWAMDDITVATCLPSMTYTPTLNPTVCQFNPITISNKMQSYFSNYTHYKWQRSTDGGTTWADISGQSGSGSPTLVGGQWEYNTSYTIPPANTTLANNGDRYRQIVATTAANLNGSTCQATDGVSIISLNVLPDCTPLTTNLLSFSGKLLNDHAQLFWTTSKEAGELHFGIERSADGIHFTRIGTVNGYNNARAENNHYSFTDSSASPGMAYYRIAMTDSRTAYSRTIQLGNKSEVFNVTATTNPFDKHVSFNVVVDKYAKVQVLLLDATGNVVKEKAYTAYTGLNNFSLQYTDDLPPGIYILKVYNQEQSQSIKLIKK